MTVKREDLMKLAHDVYFNPTFSAGEVSGQDALRNAITDALGGEYNVCSWCGHKATMNLRRANGRAVYNGEQIQIGDSEYVSVCRYHYQNPIIS